MKIDAHHHFWSYDEAALPWISPTMDHIKKDFLPVDLRRLLDKNHIHGTIAVQAQDTIHETEFLLQLGRENPFILGVVGWLNLCNPEIENDLEALKNDSLLKGVRYGLQSEPERDLMLSKDFLNGFSKLNRYGFTYDLLILPDQLKYAHTLAKKFPHTKMVVDHMAKPPIRIKNYKNWENDLRVLAQNDQVSCKISGMVTEAKWGSWRQEDFKIYLDITTEAFGIDRIIYGSDWPVCLLSATYDETINIVENYYESFSSHEKEKIFGLNAQNFYSL